jgi:manganese/zinc/iron transport system substrate-binding protein
MITFPPPLQSPPSLPTSRPRSLTHFLLCTAAALIIPACSPVESPGDPSASGPSAYPFNITCTVGMITDIVRNVVGQHATVEGIIGEGIDPHLYKPTSTDVKKLQAADLVFYNGLMLEGKMGDVLVRVARNGKPVYPVTEAAIQSEDESLLSDDQGHFDPHVWMDVKGWQQAVRVVTDALCEFDPDHADSYRANAGFYLTELAALDTYAKTSFTSIPENQRVLVTAHDAFNYMARAYGLEVRGIQGVSTESEAGVKDIEQLINFLAERKIPAVFVETSVSDKNVRALVEGAKAKGHHVTIGGELFSDAMGKAGTYEGTYLGMIDHNVTTITRGLGGNAPETGRTGKLSPKTH